MKNEDFQKTILHELNNFQKNMLSFQKDMYDFKKDMLEQIDEMKTNQRQFGVRQDEMYQVLRSIEHSNNAGKAELDSHNLRVSKIEGKLKKVSKAWQEDVEVSNL